MQRSLYNLLQRTALWNDAVSPVHVTSLLNIEHWPVYPLYAFAEMLNRMLVTFGDDEFYDEA